MTTSGEGLEASTIRTISWRLLPLIGLGYGIAFVDRVNISFASLQMNRDLHFSAAVYGLGGGLFFLSYAALEVPSNLLLVRVGARRWLARIMVTWGILAAGMMFVRTPMQFYVMRLLLGAAEAGFFPGVVYYLTLWIPARHRGRAIGGFYIAGPLSSIAMGAVAGGLLGLQGRLGLAGWQWLFLVEGLPAVLMGLAFLFYLPDRAEGVSWLSADQKTWLAQRLASDRAATTGSPAQSVLKGMLEPRVLAFSATNFLILGSYYAFNLSAPSVLQAATHLSPGQIGAIVAFGGLTGAVAMYLNARNSDLRRERYLHVVAPLVLQVAALAVMASTHSSFLFVAAYLLLLTANWAAAAVFWLAPSEILDPRFVAVGVALIGGVGQLGSFVMPYAWGLAKDATGDFRTGILALIAPYLIAVMVVLILRRMAGRQAATD